VICRSATGNEHGSDKYKGKREERFIRVHRRSLV
jgi:hypothetical protein